MYKYIFYIKIKDEFYETKITHKKKKINEIILLIIRFCNTVEYSFFC
jgi:hypothetical protein